MAHRLILISIFFLVSWLSACRKPIPSGTSNDPTLLFQASIDGNDYLWVGGLNGCEQQTMLGSDSIGQDIFIAEFMNCDNNSSLRFEFYPIESDQFNSNSLREGKRPISGDPQRTFYIADFTNMSYVFSGQPVYQWNFGDDEISNDAEPQHKFALDSAGYEVCLKVSSGSNESDICYTYIPGNPCSVDFSWDESPYKWKYTGQYTGNGTPAWKWDFASGITANTPSIDYPYAASVVSDVACLTVDNGQGCVSEICKNVIVDSSQVFVNANFLIDDKKVYENDPKVLYNTVRIIFTDEKGKKYYSNLEASTIEGYVIVESEKEFLASPQGLPTKILNLKCQSLMTSADGTSIVLKAAEGSVAFAYEN